MVSSSAVSSRTAATATAMKPTWPERRRPISRDLVHLARRAAEFEAFYNAHHRYSALKGATPEE